MRKPRKPQARCRCGHARSRHNMSLRALFQEITDTACQFCFMDCPTFQQDNLKTLEVLHDYEKKKKEYTE